MTFFGPLSRAVALLGLIASAGAVSAPAFAAPADVELIKSYIGEWRGRGTLIGATTETVLCRLSLKPGNQDKVNYSGRCTIAGKTLSLNGTIAYLETTKRYEAAMTSNVAFSGIAIGQKRGRGVTFNLHERESDEEGKPLNITSQIILTPDAINVKFEVMYLETGEYLEAQVPFSK